MGLARRPAFVRIALGAIFLVAIAWGARLTLLEGFVYAWPRAFGGDFAAAMYDPQWWDGSGVFYGPVLSLKNG